MVAKLHGFGVEESEGLGAAGADAVAVMGVAVYGEGNTCGYELVPPSLGRKETFLLLVSLCIDFHDDPAAHGMGNDIVYPSLIPSMRF